MTHISGFERSQLLLLPEAIDDYVVADNPVRFIDALVGGPPGYAPGDLLSTAISTACGQAGGLRPNATATSRSSGCCEP